MFFALTLMNLMHPGTILAGEDSRFAKKTKEEKSQEKELKRQAKQDKNAEKQSQKSNSTSILQEV
jgi:hypothetical protein